MSGSPAVLLTPGRTRNIAQDMEALRLSRQDNPYLQVLSAPYTKLFNTYVVLCVIHCLCNDCSKLWRAERV